MPVNLGLALVVGLLIQAQAAPPSGPTAEAAVTAALAKADVPRHVALVAGVTFQDQRHGALGQLLGAVAETD